MPEVLLEAFLEKCRDVYENGGAVDGFSDAIGKGRSFKEERPFLVEHLEHLLCAELENDGDFAALGLALEAIGC